MKQFVIIAGVLAILTATCHGGDIATLAESSQRPLPSPDVIVKIEKDTFRVYVIAGDLDKPLATGGMKVATTDRNELRKAVLNLTLEIAAHFHRPDAMFVIVEDECKPLSAGLYYKAYIKRFFARDVTAVTQGSK